MAIIKTDTFTEASDTALESHTSDSGGGWSGGDTTSFDVIAASDEVEGDAQRRLGYGDEGPSSADQFCSVNGRTVAVDGNRNFAAVVRGDGNAHGAANAYYYQQNGDGFTQLKKQVAGSETQLDSWTHTGFSASTYYDVKTEVIGTAIKGYVAGTERVSAIDSAITAAGNIGIFMRQSASGNAVITSLASETIGIDVEIIPRIEWISTLLNPWAFLASIFITGCARNNQVNRRDFFNIFKWT